MLDQDVRLAAMQASKSNAAPAEVEVIVSVDSSSLRI